MLGVVVVGEEAQRAILDDRRLLRQRPGALHVVGELARLDLAGLDVRLVERIDPHDGAGDSRRDLPPEELGREPVDVRDVHANDGTARRDERLDGCVLCVIGRGGQADVDEEPIGAVLAGGRQWLAIDGDDCAPVLARSTPR